MANIRRWYLFLVSAVSLQAVTWAIITLLRNLLVPALGAGGGGISFNARAIAMQIAIIVIGLPIYLAHWLQAKRRAAQDSEEGDAVLRHLYLFAMMAGFLGPGVANAFTLLNSLLRPLLGAGRIRSGLPNLEPGNAIIYHGVALVVLGLLWFYHRRIAASEAQIGREPEEGSTAIRRVYLYGFSAAGLTLVIADVISLVQWLLFQIGAERAIGSHGVTRLASDLAQVLIGLPLWLLFWSQAQKHFAQDSREQASALRKFYLYLAVFIGVLMVVSNGTGLLAGLLRRLLDLPSQGDVRRPLAVMTGAAVLWAYHAAVLHRDAAVLVERPRQAMVRRAYLYLVASVGLAAFLVGLGGVTSVLIRSLASEAFIVHLRQQLAAFTATLAVGLLVWLVPWRRAQRLAADAAGGQQERLSQVRKSYLYFYLFVATMTMLTSAVFIVYQLVTLALGARTALNLLVELGHAIAFTLIAVVVWLYHGAIVRHEGRLEAAAAAQQLAAWRVAVVDGGDGRLGRLLLERLRQELPQVTWQPVGLTAAAAAAMDTEVSTAPAAVLGEVDVIVGPWTMTWAGDGGNQEWVTALDESQARKLLLPVRPAGWAWVGIEPREQDELIRQTVHTLRQMVRGQGLESGRRVNLAAIIVAVVAGLVLLAIGLGTVVGIF